MLTCLTAFFKSEDGAVTVDWVVLSAVIIGLGLVVLNPIAFSVNSSTDKVADKMDSIQVGYISQQN